MPQSNNIATVVNIQQPPNITPVGGRQLPWYQAFSDLQT